MQNIHEAGAQSFGGSVNTGFSDPEPRSALSDRGLHYAFKEPEQLARLNAFANSFLGGTYLDPKEPLKELAGRIGQLGLSMKFANNVPLAVGDNQIPLQVFGDKFGVTPNTDLSQGFDKGQDYPDMFLGFTLLQTKTGYVFTDVSIKSQLCTDSPVDVGSEMTNTCGAGQVCPAMSSVSQNEEIDLVNSVQSYLEENEVVQTNIFIPIIESLEKSIDNTQYSKEKAFSRFSYAVDAGIAILPNSPVLTENQKYNITNNILINFEKNYQA